MTQKEQKLLSPKKIRKMYRGLAEESLRNGVAHDAKKRIWRYRIAMTFVILYAFTITMAAIIGGAVLAKKAGL